MGHVVFRLRGRLLSRLPSAYNNNAFLMATPKPYDRYPSTYPLLFERAMKEDYALVFNSPREAKNFRARLYAFRTALLDESHKSPSLALTISLVTLSIQGNTLALSYGPNTVEDSSDARPNLPESGRLLDVGDL